MPGNYLTADTVESFTVTPATLQHWTNTFREFKHKKIKVPVPSGTHFQVDADHNRGDVIALSNDGKSLWATVELIGKDAPCIAASNGVSIYAEPEWEGPDGANYEWPIRHPLLTPDPRIPGLKGFMPIAANNSTFNVPVLRYKAMAAATKPRTPAPAPVRKPLALDGYAMNEDGLGVPGVGDGAALPGDETSTAGDVNAEAGGEGLKSHIKTHFLDKAHTVLDDEQMEQEEKLEAIKELLTEMGTAFWKPSRMRNPRRPRRTARGADEETEPKGAAMSNVPRMPDLRKKLGCGMPNSQLTSRLRRTEIDGLFTSGRINRPQHEQLLCSSAIPITWRSRSPMRRSATVSTMPSPCWPRTTRGFTASRPARNSRRKSLWPWRIPIARTRQRSTSGRGRRQFHRALQQPRQQAEVISPPPATNTKLQLFRFFVEPESCSNRSTRTKCRASARVSSI